VRLFEDQDEMILASTIKLKMRPVRFDDGHFEFEANGKLDDAVAGKMARLLREWTGIKWIITKGDGPAGPTLNEQDAARLQKQIDAVSSHPLVEEVLTAFPGAKVAAVEDMALLGATGPGDDDADDDADDDGRDEGVADHA
jgi:DNA polymerase-3 subunit gamma/tau